MRYRPLCAVFAALILVVSVLRFCGVPLWGIRRFTPEEQTQIEKCRSLTGTIRERWKSDDGYTYILNNTAAERAGKKYYPGKVRVTKTEELFEIGTVLKISGKCSFYESASNPGGFDKKTYYEAEGICCGFTMKRFSVVGYKKRYRFLENAVQVREKLTDLYLEALGSEYGPVLSAMITGERGEMEDETRVNYTVSGLGHLLAISGLHVGIVGMALLRLLIKLKLKRPAASVISSLALFAYCMITGAHDSTLRAFIMFSVMAGARCFLRSYDMPSSLSLAGIILLALRPQRLFTAGFLLSFGAAGGLAFVYPVIKQSTSFAHKVYPENRRQRIAFALYDGFLVWLSVNLATIPILLWFYREFPVYGFLANILFVPLTEAVILLGIAGGIAGLIFPVAGRWILQLPGALVFVQDGAGAVIRRLPGCVYITGQPDIVRILSYTIGVLALLLWVHFLKNGKTDQNIESEEKIRQKSPRRENRVFIPIISVVLMSLILIRPYHAFYITAVDVGQGDSLLITNGSGSAMMIDGGSSSYDHCGKYILLPYLKAEGISELEGVFVTHNDSDHMNGILELLRMKASRLTNVRIKRLLMPVWMQEDETGIELAKAAEKCGTEVLYLYSGETVQSGEVKLRTLFPPADGSFTGNEGSLVLGLHYQGFTALFTGDLEGEAEELVAEEIGHYDCLKAAHHGSNGSTSAEFLEAVSPSVCIISAPKVSIYNHPGPETIKRIEDAGAAWFQTGTQGAVSVGYNNGRIEVCTYK